MENELEINISESISTEKKENLSEYIVEKLNGLSFKAAKEVLSEAMERIEDYSILPPTSKGKAPDASILSNKSLLDTLIKNIENGTDVNVPDNVKGIIKKYLFEIERVLPVIKFNSMEVVKITPAASTENIPAESKPNSTDNFEDNLCNNIMEDLKKYIESSVEHLRIKYKIPSLIIYNTDKIGLMYNDTEMFKLYQASK